MRINDNTATTNPVNNVFIFLPAVNWLTRGFIYATLSLNWLTCRLETIGKKYLMNEQAINSDTRQRNMYERTDLFRTIFC